MAKPRTSSKVKNAWNAKNYDRITITIAKGERDRLKLAASAAGVSVSRFIVDAVNAAAPDTLTPLDDTSKQKKDRPEADPDADDI